MDNFLFQHQVLNYRTELCFCFMETHSWMQQSHYIWEFFMLYGYMHLQMAHGNSYQFCSCFCSHNTFRNLVHVFIYSSELVVFLTQNLNFVLTNLGSTWVGISMLRKIGNGIVLTQGRLLKYRLMIRWFTCYVPLQQGFYFLAHYEFRAGCQ